MTKTTKKYFIDTLAANKSKFLSLIKISDNDFNNVMLKLNDYIKSDNFNNWVKDNQIPVRTVKKANNYNIVFNTSSVLDIKNVTSCYNFFINDIEFLTAIEKYYDGFDNIDRYTIMIYQVIK